MTISLAPLLLALGSLSQDPVTPPELPDDEMVVAVKVTAPEGVDTSDLAVTVTGPADSFRYDPHASEVRVKGLRRWKASAKCGLTSCPVEKGREFHRYHSEEVAFGPHASEVELVLRPRSIVQGQLTDLAVPSHAWVTLTGPYPRSPDSEETFVEKRRALVTAEHGWRFAFGDLPPGGYELGVVYVEGTSPLPIRTILLRGEAMRRVDLRASDVPPTHLTKVMCRYEGLEVTSGLEFYLVKEDSNVVHFGPRHLMSEPVVPIGYSDGGFLLPVLVTKNEAHPISVYAAGHYWDESSALLSAGAKEVILRMEAAHPPEDPRDQLDRTLMVEGKVQIDPVRLKGLTGDLQVAIGPKLWKDGAFRYVGTAPAVERVELKPDGTYRFEGLRCGPHVLMVELASAGAPLPLLLAEHELTLPPKTTAPQTLDLDLGPWEAEGNLRMSFVDRHGNPARHVSSVIYFAHGANTTLTGQLPLLGQKGDDLFFEWPPSLMAHKDAQGLMSHFWLYDGSNPQQLDVKPGQKKLTVKLP